MDLTRQQQAALERWHLLGTTTPTHPILQFAYELYFEPMGIRVDALSYDALAALEKPETQITLISPRFDAKKIDRAWSQFPVIEPLLPLLDYIDPVFAANGAIKEFSILKEPTDTTLLKTFEDSHAPEIFALSDSLTQVAKLYIDAALAMLIRAEVISSELAKQFVENPRQYAAYAFHLFTHEASSEDKKA